MTKILRGIGVYDRKRCTPEFLMEKADLSKVIGFRIVGGVYRKDKIILIARKAAR